MPAMHDFAHDERRPTTPTGPSSGAFKSSTAMRALNTNQPVQGTFFEDATPVDRTRAHDTERNQLRDSHDLSFADGATVRDSVVDNMLLSLDQFSTGNMFGGGNSGGSQYAQYSQDESFLRDNSFRQPGARHRGHTYTSSRSSDYDLHPDESTRFAAHASQGRRSNSSNTIGLPMSRKGSAREPLSGRQQNGPYGQYQQAGHLRGSSNKGSKGSGSSSMDFGTAGVLGNHRLGFGKRSASFDHSNFGDRSRSSPVKMESVLDRGRTAYQNYADDYDAAPEPTIPAGPRRIPEAPPQSPISYLPQPPFAPPPAPGTRRRGSVRSNTSYKTLRKNKSQLEPNMRAQAQEFVNASTLRDLPPVPALQDSAPSPSVNTRKGFFPQQTQVATPKERPGFFRRVFGGGSSKSQTQLSNTSSASYSSPQESPAATKQTMPDIDSIYSQARPRTTPSNQSHITNQLKNMPKNQQSGAQNQKDQTPSTPAVITKKPSSFFRRRKKSVSENTKPPVMALDFTPPPKPVALPQQSPGVSSLRKVMNPYLNESGRTGDNFYDARDHETTEDSSNNERAQGFSPGYRPHKDATVRTVQKGSRDEDKTPPSSRGDQVMLTHLASPDSPKMKLKLKHGKAAKPVTHEDTFLADSSSCNEDRSGRASPTGERSGAEETRRPSTCPTPSSVHQFSSEGKNDQEDGRRTELLAPAPPSKQTTVSSIGGAASQSATEVEDEGWLRTKPPKSGPTSRNPSPAAKRVWIDTTAGEDGSDDLKLPLEGARASQKSLLETSPVESPNDVFHSATSLPIVQVESRDSDNMPSIVESRSMHNEPTDGERARALQIFTGDDSAAQKAQAAAILGDVTLSSARTRKAFMDLFDWAGFNILGAMRDMCGKIVLKAETQQVDRILMSLSERWCECNPHHGFKAVDVVHTICYSILLLNTDLHMADIESRMTRSQFVKNTLPTVTRVCQDAVKAAGGETLRPNSTHFRRPSLPWNDKSEPTSPNAEATSFPAELTEETPENKRTRSRLSLRPPMRSASEGVLSSDSGLSESNMLVNAPYNGPMKGWEFQIEMVLKDFYESIRKQRLPLHGAAEPTLHPQASSNNLSVSGMLRRTPSMLSKTPSDNASYRGRSQGDFRSVGNRWTSKNRSRKNLYPSSTVASSRTSLDDGSVWSPAGSSTWSRYSYGKTGTSMSMDSLGTHFAAADYQQAIGFANALSQAIIREEGMTIASDEEFSRVAPLLEDETLELVGAPWAKEGILKHKRHLDSVDKRAKDRAWTECFAVVEKGYMRLFSFSMNSKSTRHKKTRPSAGSVVGGGNWMDNAEALDSFPLRQTIASALPPPGYSKTRPHVFALSLPNGAVHLFQVGTPDIVREFVCTTNYWSARLSKEPLTGGVSSMEYGWGENVINPALIRQDSSPSVQGHMPRPSVTSSLRSSMDHATGTPKARLPGDKITLSDWSPPPCSMMASSLMEVDQLRALIDYVKNIEAELGYHNELRAPLLIAFSPRHPNAARAMANWERKSQYLLREIVKFRTYIDTLTAAQVQKQKIYAEREALEQELEASEADGVADAVARGAEEDGAKADSKAISPQPVH